MSNSLQSESPQSFDAYSQISNRSINIRNKSRSSSSSSSRSTSSSSEKSFNLYNTQVIEPELVLDSISHSDSLHSESSIIENYLKFESEGNKIDFRRQSITDFKRLDFDPDNNLLPLQKPEQTNNTIIQQSTLYHKCTNSISCQIL